MGNSKQLQVGNATEQKVANLFNRYGYWVHILQKGKDGGQPVDIVAIKNNVNWLIDAKNIEEEISFPFSRIESNQITSLDYALNFAGIKKVGFAIYFKRFDKIYYLPYIKFIKLKEEKRKSVRYDELYEMEAYLK